MKTLMLDKQLMHAHLKLLQFVRSEMKPGTNIKNLTLVQLNALIFLKEHDSAQISEISNYFDIAIPTATVLVDRLSSIKLVRREPDMEDRRVTRVSLTNKGEILLQKAMREREKILKKMLSRLTMKDKEDFLRIIKNITQS